MSVTSLLLTCLVALACTTLSNAACSYNVTVETGSSRRAATRFGVEIKLSQGSRSTPGILLENKSGTRFLSKSKVNVLFDGVCLTKPCVTLRVVKGGDSWYAKSIKITVPDEHTDIIINNFQFHIDHWIKARGYKTCACEKMAYVAFGGTA